MRSSCSRRSPLGPAGSYEAGGGGGDRAGARRGVGVQGVARWTSLLAVISGSTATTPVRGISLLFPDVSFPFQSGGISVSGFWVIPAASFEQSPPEPPASNTHTGKWAVGFEEDLTC